MEIRTIVYLPLLIFSVLGIGRAGSVPGQGMTRRLLEQSEVEVIDENARLKSAHKKTEVRNKNPGQEDKNDYGPGLGFLSDEEATIVNNNVDVVLRSMGIATSSHNKNRKDEIARKGEAHQRNIVLSKTVRENRGKKNIISQGDDNGKGTVPVVKGVGPSLRGFYVRDGKKKDLVQVSVVNEETGKPLPVTVGGKVVGTNEWVPVNQTMQIGTGDETQNSSKKAIKHEDNANGNGDSGYLPMKHPASVPEHKPPPNEEYLPIQLGKVKDAAVAGASEAQSDNDVQHLQNTILQNAWINVVKKVFDKPNPGQSQAAPNPGQSQAAPNPGQSQAALLRKQKVDSNKETLVAKSETLSSDIHMNKPKVGDKQTSESVINKGGVSQGNATAANETLQSDRPVDKQATAASETLQSDRPVDKQATADKSARDSTHNASGPGLNKLKYIEVKASSAADAIESLHHGDKMDKDKEVEFNLDIHPNVKSDKDFQAKIFVHGPESAVELNAHTSDTADRPYSDSPVDHARVAPVGSVFFNMSEWGPWSTCSETCGGKALRVRTRKCLETMTGEAVKLSADMPCRGSFVEWKMCGGMRQCPANRRIFPEDGIAFSATNDALAKQMDPSPPKPWSEWSRCSTFCGPKRLKIRERKCSAERLDSGVCVEPTMQWAWCKPKPCEGEQNKNYGEDSGHKQQNETQNDVIGGANDKMKANNHGQESDKEAAHNGEGTKALASPHDNADKAPSPDAKGPHEKWPSDDAPPKPTEKGPSFEGKQLADTASKLPVGINTTKPDIQHFTKQYAESATDENSPIAVEGPEEDHFKEYLPIAAPRVQVHAIPPPPPKGIHAAEHDAAGHDAAEHDDDCALADWSKWSTCSQTCGVQALKIRTRACRCRPGKECKHKLVDWQKCALPSCPGSTEEYAPWTGFSKCTKTCGGGWRKRTRRCNSKLNRNCDHDLLIGIQVCNTKACPHLLHDAPAKALARPTSLFQDQSPYDVNPEPVCGFNPCEEFGCLDRFDAKCIPDANCNPVFFNEEGKLLQQCKGWQRFYLRMPETFCGFDTCKNSACMDEFGRCEVDLDCRPVIVGANNRIISCREIEQRRRQQEIAPKGEDSMDEDSGSYFNYLNTNALMNRGR